MQCIHTLDLFSALVLHLGSPNGREITHTEDTGYETTFFGKYVNLRVFF